MTRPAIRTARVVAGLIAAGLLATPGLAQQTAPSKTAVATLPAATKIMKRADKAMGTEKAASFENQLMVHEMTMAAQGMTIQIKTYSEGSDKLLVQSSVMGMTMLQGLDGDVAWASDPMQGPRLLSPEETEQMRSSPERGGSLLEAYPNVVTLADESFEGRPCWKVSMKSKTGKETIGYFDQETHLLNGMSGKQPSPMGEIPFRAVLTEYVNHHGMMLPGTMKFEAMGTEQVLKLQDVQVNLETMPSFAPPPEVAALIKPKP